MLPLALLLIAWVAPALAADPSPQSSPPVREGHRVRFGLVVADPATRTVSFPASVQMTNGLVEYAVVTDYGKTHESLLVTAALPMDVQTALLLLRARPSGTNGLQTPTVPIPPGSGVRATVAWPESGGSTPIPLNDLFALTAGGPAGAITGALRTGPWLFNGSLITPEGFGAHFEGSIMSLIDDPIAILNNPGPDRSDDEVHVPAPGRLPPVGTPVTVFLAPETQPSAPLQGPSATNRLSHATPR